MVYLARVRVRPPVRLGDIIVQDILGTGANLIASDDLET
jgi:CxxC motif-containing protein